MMSRHDFIVRSFLHSRVTGDSLLFGRFLWRRSSKELFFGDDSRVCGGLVATKWARFIIACGKKVGRGAGRLRAALSPWGGGGCFGGGGGSLSWEGGGCGGGAVVVIACSTCLNSSHIHLGPSFTLDCFYKRAPARQNISRNVFY